LFFFDSFYCFPACPASDGARCLKVGVHKNRTLFEAFHEHCTYEFGGESRGLDWVYRSTWLNLVY